MRSLVLLCSLTISSASLAATLTGLNGTPTDASGNWHTGWYNTFGGNGDAGKNAYLIQGSNPYGSFLNSGNTAESTKIDVDLSAPGRYDFLAVFEGNEIFAGRDFWSLNLFFDGYNAAPAISVFGRPTWGLSPEVSTANSGRQLSVDGKTNVMGSGTLDYGNIRLVRFATFVDPFQMDRVNNFNLGSSGRNDHVAAFTLEVVPEPSSLAVAGLGLLGLMRQRSRRR